MSRSGAATARACSTGTQLASCKRDASVLVRPAARVRRAKRSDLVEALGQPTHLAVLRCPAQLAPTEAV